MSNFACDLYRTFFYYTGFDLASFKTSLFNLYENIDGTKFKSPYLPLLI